MTDLSPAVLPPSLIQPTPAPPTALPTPTMSADEQAKRAQIRQTAQKFEGAFLSIMLQQMFEGTDTQAPFGGGPGEQMFKSFMAEAMAGKMVKTGGVGLAASVQREMLKMQGLH